MAEIFPNFAGEGPKTWVSSKLQWNPNQNVDELLHEWYVTAVGEESAVYLKQHFDLWETFWTGRIFETDWYTRWVNAERRSNFMRFDQTDYLLADFLDVNVDPGVTAVAVRTTADKETILGTLDFSIGPWVEAMPIDHFLVMDTETLGPAETKAYLLWDDEYLYVGYENFDDFPQEMVISDDAPNGWWRSGADDSVETFLVNESDDVIMAFFSNPISVKFAMEREKYSTLRPVISEVSGWEVNSNIESDHWNTVQAIPFSAIDFDPNETDQLAAFLFRNYHGHSFFLGWNGGAPWRLEHLYTVQLVE